MKVINKDRWNVSIKTAGWDFVSVSHACSVGQLRFLSFIFSYAKVICHITCVRMWVCPFNAKFLESGIWGHMSASASLDHGRQS